MLKKLIINYYNYQFLKKTMDKELELELEQQYINSLSEKEKKALEIAKKHLGSLFTLCKTTGYIQWKKKEQVK